MTAAALAIGAVLACACVLFVALPFLREPDPVEDRLDEPGALEKRALELAEEKDRALAALKELEFDHRTGKISDEDYRELIGPLRSAGRRGAQRARADGAAVCPRQRTGGGCSGEPGGSPKVADASS